MNDILFQKSDDGNEYPIPRLGNCYYCKAEVFEEKMKTKKIKNDKSSKWTGGSMMICRKCHNEIGG